MSARIVVVYYSATGNVAAMAEAVTEGAESVGAEVRLRRVVEIAPPEAIASNPRWAAHEERDRGRPTVTLDDLEWADGMAFGSPTRFGDASSQLRAFMDTTGGLWAQGKLHDKVATSFTSSSTAHGGLESTILAMSHTFYHWGSIILPLGYADPHVRKVSGNPYGASFVSRKSAPSDDISLDAARAQGRRLGQVAAWVRAGRESEQVTEQGES